MKPLRLRFWQWLTWRVDCCYCKRIVRRRLLAFLFTPTISHGICPACYARQMATITTTSH